MVVYDGPVTFNCNVKNEVVTAIGTHSTYPGDPHIIVTKCDACGMNHVIRVREGNYRVDSFTGDIAPIKRISGAR